MFLKFRGASSLMVAVGSLSLASASPAQPTRPRQSPYVASLESCHRITTDAERLRCFDASVAKLLQADKAGQVSLIDQQQAREVRRSLFGFSVPKLRILGGSDSAEAKEITAKVSRVRGTAEGRFLLTLEDGAVWQTVERPKEGQRPRSGSTVRIRKAALGSYFMNIDGNRAVRASRAE